MRILSKKYLSTFSIELLKSQLKSTQKQIDNFSKPYNDQKDKWETKFLQLHRILADIKKELQTR